MVLGNGMIFGSEQFSNGEVSYKPFQVNNDINRLDIYFQDNKDITNLQFAIEYIRSKEPASKIYLNMLYVPYGRMDREIDGYVFSLEMFANIINRYHIDAIYTLDNHTEEIKNKIHNVVELNGLLNKYVDKVIEEYQPDYIIFPDGGAMDRYPSILEVCITGKIPYFYGNKERVLDDSRLIKFYEIYDNGFPLVGKKILIIDDICCTGGTVLEAAQILVRKGVSDIALWVPHCENNVIKYPIVREDSPISKIYTSDTIIRNYTIPEIEVIPMNSLVDREDMEKMI